MEVMKNVDDARRDATGAARLSRPGSKRAAVHLPNCHHQQHSRGAEAGGSGQSARRTLRSAPWPPRPPSSTQSSSPPPPPPPTRQPPPPQQLWPPTPAATVAPLVPAALILPAGRGGNRRRAAARRRLPLGLGAVNRDASPVADPAADADLTAVGAAPSPLHGRLRVDLLPAWAPSRARATSNTLHGGHDLRRARRARPTVGTTYDLQLHVGQRAPHRDASIDKIPPS